MMFVITTYHILYKRYVIEGSNEDQALENFIEIPDISQEFDNGYMDSDDSFDIEEITNQLIVQYQIPFPFL